MAKPESAPQRAWNNTKDWLLTHILAWVLAFIFPGSGTVLTTWLIPPITDVNLIVLYGFLGGVAGLLLLFGSVYFIYLIIAPYRQRNEARRLLSERPKPMPLQDRGRLLRTIYEAKTAAIEFIDCRKQLARLYEQNPNDINEGKASKVLKESQTKYTEALRLLDCEKLVSGDEYEPFINSLVMFMNLGVTFWNSTVNGKGDFLITFKPMLEANVKETIKHIDNINNQAVQKP